MIYVCSVYSLEAHSNSAADRAVRERRYQYAVDRVGDWMKEGIIGLFCPIAHCHVAANKRGLPKDYSFWKRNDRHMIDKCDEVWVLKMKGWKRSEGITDEVNYAKELGKTIKYFECRDETV